MIPIAIVEDEETCRSRLQEDISRYGKEKGYEVDALSLTIPIHRDKHLKI